MFPIPKSKDKNNKNNEYPVHQVAGQINANYVCLDCRFSRRVKLGAEDPTIRTEGSRENERYFKTHPHSVDGQEVKAADGEILDFSEVVDKSQT